MENGFGSARQLGDLAVCRDRERGPNVSGNKISTMTARLPILFKCLAVLMVFFISACVSDSNVPQRKFQLAWPAPPEEPKFKFLRTYRSSADIVKETATDKFRRMATGANVAGKTIEKPYGLAAHAGVLYIGDTQHRRVAVYDSNNNSYREIGTEGAGSLAKPLGMALDQQGKLYVVDGTAKRAVIFDKNGKYIGAVGGREILKRPTGIAVNASGSRIYVVDTGGVDNTDHHVVVFSPTGEILFKIGTRGSKDGEFNLPLNATMGPDGTLYVVDGGNFRVQAFTEDGKFRFKIGSVGRRSGQFARPKGIATDKNGNLYVTDAAFGNVQIFNNNGELLMWVGKRSTKVGPGHYMLPSGVAVDKVNGQLYFADQFFRKVDVYQASATLTGAKPGS